MAISIDSVYKEVLNIINNESLEKENVSFEGGPTPVENRRDYITPDEFNILAERAQEDLFEKSLSEYKAFWVAGRDGNYEEHRDFDLIATKLEPFRVEGVELNKTSGVPVDLLTYPPTDIYWIESVNNDGASAAVVYKEVAKNYLVQVRSYSTSKAFFKKDLEHIYYRKTSSKVEIFPEPTNNPNIDFIKKPTPPKWGGFTDINTGIVAYSPSATVDFELHESERSSLVNKILYLTGMSTDDVQTSEMASRDEASNEVVKNN
tara:strand:+ start:844 stop:1629 length:786 start_codon:yes stop_codon:yes gene_type:complete